MNTLECDGSLSIIDHMCWESIGNWWILTQMAIYVQSAVWPVMLTDPLHSDHLYRLRALLDLCVGIQWLPMDSKHKGPVMLSVAGS